MARIGTIEEEQDDPLSGEKRKTTTDEYESDEHFDDGQESGGEQQLFGEQEDKFQQLQHEVQYTAPCQKHKHQLLQQPAASQPLQTPGVRPSGEVASLSCPRHLHLTPFPPEISPEG